MHHFSTRQGIYAPLDSLTGRLLHVVAGLELEAGGPSITIPQLCRHMRAADVNTELHSCGVQPNDSCSDVTFYPTYPFADRLRICPDMYRSLSASVRRSDIVHSHGLWMMPSYYCDRVTRKNKCVHVISTHGALAAKAFEKSSLKKSLLWHLWQKHAIQRARCVCATSEKEVGDIRRAGVKVPIANIGIGVDPPRFQPTEKHIVAKPRVLFLGRLDPIKCIPNLIEAWKRIESDIPNWELHIVGSGSEDYIRHLESILAASKTQSVFIRPPVYDDKKSDEYYYSKLFVLPSETENFSVAVAEALAHGVPCIVSKGAPWEIIEKNNCGWWVDNDPMSLSKALQIATKLHDGDHKLMSDRGIQLTNDLFTWKSIALKYRSLYSWLQNGSSRPKFVDTI